MLLPFALSYNNINLLVYLIIIPIVWTRILDRKYNTKYTLTLSYIAGMLIAATLQYTHTIDLIKTGIHFCIYMQHIHHCTYAESCVIYCMLLPLAITVILISLPQKPSHNHAITT